MNYTAIAKKYIDSAGRSAQTSYRNVSEHIRHLDEDIRWAASAAFQGLAIAFAAWLHPNFFSIAVVTGLIWPRFVRETLDGIKRDIGRYHLLAVSILIPVLKLPPVTMAYSIWTGARIGATLRAADETPGTAAAGASG